jgi:tetratricopeptide (TPR) repeat protein
VLASSVSVSSTEVWAARTGDLPRAWVEAGLEATPSRGIAMVENDSTAAGMILVTAIEGARPDVSLLVKQRVFEGWRTRRELGRVDSSAQLFGARPITWEVGVLPVPAQYRAHIGLPLGRLVEHDSAVDGGDIAASARALVRLFDHGSVSDPAATSVFAQALNVIGRTALERGDLASAMLAYDAALAVHPRFARGWINRGAVAAAAGDYAVAIADTEQGLRLEPNHEIGLVNLARYYLRADRDEDARGIVVRLREARPKNASGPALEGLIEARAGNLEAARALSSQALAMDARNVDALGLADQLERSR